MTFVLDPDQNPVVSLNEITVTAEPLLSSNVSTNWPGDSLTLLESGDSNLFTIDSSTPYLWLPDSVCSKFERALGLTYDDSLQLYTFGSNSSQHDVLVNWNMTFHFRIADLPESPNLVSLSLPYAAFDLQLSYPYPGLLAHESSPPTNYFPLRKAADSTQYTIGRAFLQETYLKVDYERNNFSIHKATFSQSALTDTDLISITRPKNSIFGGPKVSRKPALSKAAIAGIAIGTLVSSIASFILFISVHRARSSQRYEGKNDSVFKQGKGSSNSRVIRWLFRLPRPDAPTEMGASYRFAFEAPHDREIMELPAKSSKRELEGSQPYTPQHQETNYSNKGNAVYAIGHDPEKPVELPYRSSARGYYEPETGPQMPFANPNTALVDASVKSAWGLSRQNTQTSAAISGPTSTSSKRSSKESSPVFIVSPMTPREVSPIFPREMSPEYSSLSIIARREARYSSNDSRVRQYRGHDTSASSDNLVSGDFQSSNGSTMIDHALQGPRQLFSR